MYYVKIEIERELHGAEITVLLKAFLILYCDLFVTKVRTKDRVFDNICHLISYHQNNNIPIISKDNELLLENPVFKQF